MEAAANPSTVEIAVPVQYMATAADVHLRQSFFGVGTNPPCTLVREWHTIRPAPL
jgi:hypothetical protein